MRAVISGKRYDTETATIIAEWSSGTSRRDFRYIEEALYRTAKGNWFIAGRGGGLTHYRSRVGDMWGEGSRIVPLSATQAREWLEERGKVRAIEKHFADAIEDA